MSESYEGNISRRALLSGVAGVIAASALAGCVSESSPQIPGRPESTYSPEAPNELEAYRAMQEHADVVMDCTTQWLSDELPKTIIFDKTILAAGYAMIYQSVNREIRNKTTGNIEKLNLIHTMDVAPTIDGSLEVMLAVGDVALDGPLPSMMGAKRVATAIWAIEDSVLVTEVQNGKKTYAEVLRAIQATRQKGDQDLPMAAVNGIRLKSTSAEMKNPQNGDTNYLSTTLAAYADGRGVEAEQFTNVPGKDSSPRKASSNISAERRDFDKLVQYFSQNSSNVTSQILASRK